MTVLEEAGRWGTSEAWRVLSTFNGNGFQLKQMRLLRISNDAIPEGTHSHHLFHRVAFRNG
ncbi:hypothetical protein hmeg3_01945 [Herbaspirillum sp. meg3]|nr:hypothetical protein hmeg3_01945 [Herbaspirillum sp. meg3]